MESFITEKRFNLLLEKFGAIKPVLVLGDVGVDKYTFGNVRRISPEAPVPVLEVSKEWLKLGLAANVSDNLKGLNVASTLCGISGNDNNGNLLENLLEECGLKTWGIVRLDKRTTTFKERVTTKTQQICRIDYETSLPIDSSIEQRIFDRVDNFFDDHGPLILQDYGKGLISKSLAQRLIAQFKEAGKLVAVDPHRTCDPEIYKGAHLLKPNLIEAQMLAETLGYRGNDLSEVADLLVDKLKLEKIVITLGGDGMAMIDTKKDGKLHIIPTVANEVFDVSGAGDTVISAIVAALESGATLKEAAWIGNCAAGVVVGKRGTAQVNLLELKEFYQHLKESLGA